MNFFGKVFNGIDHAVAWVISKAIPAAGKAAQEVEAVAESPIGTLVAAAFGQKGEQVQQDVVAIAGSIVAARNRLGDAFAAKAADLGLDEKAIRSVETIYSQIAAAIQGAPARPAPSQS